MLRRSILAAALAAGGLAATRAVPASAQDYPTRAVTFVVPYAPGGATDALARLVAQAMGPQLGQTIVVENVPGAGGTVGMGRVVRADPDGYTLVFSHMANFAASAALYPRFRFDPLEDLAPIGVAATVPMLLAVNPKAGIADVAALRAKLRDGDAKFGHAGKGSVNHIASVAFLAEVEGKAVEVAYRGGGPANNDLAAGIIDTVIDQTASSMPLHLGGLIRGIAVSSRERLPQIPDVPTFTEAGVPGFGLQVWNALAAPKGTPPAIVARLEAALAKALDDHTLTQRYADLAIVLPAPPERGGAAMKSLVAAETGRLGRIIERGGIRAE